jgi:hypothetical protein
MELRRSESSVRGPLSQGFWTALITDIDGLVERLGERGLVSMPGIAEGARTNAGLRFKVSSVMQPSALYGWAQVVSGNRLEPWWYVRSNPNAT